METWTGEQFWPCGAYGTCFGYLSRQMNRFDDRLTARIDGLCERTGMPAPTKFAARAAAISRTGTTAVELIAGLCTLRRNWSVSDDSRMS